VTTKRLAHVSIESSQGEQRLAAQDYLTGASNKNEEINTFRTGVPYCANEINFQASTALQWTAEYPSADDVRQSKPARSERTEAHTEETDPYNGNTTEEWSSRRVAGSV
jgi:hypothetical protein